MKVIIPVIDNQAGRNIISPRLHSAKYVCIYNSKSNSFDWNSTNEIIQNNSNLGEELINREIFAVISSPMPAMALSVFTTHGLKVYKADGNDVLSNIKLFQNNQLELLSSDESRKVSNCNGSCSSCSSTCN